MSNPIVDVHIDNIVSAIMLYQEGKLDTLRFLDVAQRELDMCYKDAEEQLPRVVECPACHGRGRVRLCRVASAPYEVICKACNGDGHVENRS